MFNKIQKLLFTLFFIIGGGLVVYGTVGAVTLIMVPQGGTGAGTYASQAVLIGSSTNPIATTTWTVPQADGTANQILKTDGSGALTWQADNDTGGGGGDFATTTADYWLTTKDTADLTEGTSLYFTNGRVADYINGSSTMAVADWNIVEGRVDQSLLVGSSPTFLTPTISGLVWDGVTLATSSDILNLWNIYESGGNVGIGTSSPTHLLEVDGTGYFNGTLEVNSNGQFNSNLEIDGNLIVNGNASLGSLIFADNAGFVSAFDMTVTSGAGAGTVEGYSFLVDGNDVLSIYAESNGSGGIQNQAVGIGTTTPWGGYALAVAGGGLFTGDLLVRATTTMEKGLSIDIPSGENAKALEIDQNTNDYAIYSQWRGDATNGKYGYYFTNSGTVAFTGNGSLFTLKNQNYSDSGRVFDVQNQGTGCTARIVRANAGGTNYVTLIENWSAGNTLQLDLKAGDSSAIFIKASTTKNIIELTDTGSANVSSGNFIVADFDTGYTNKFLDFEVNNTDVFTVDNTGKITASSSCMIMTSPDGSQSNCCVDNADAWSCTGL